MQSTLGSSHPARLVIETATMPLDFPKVRQIRQQVFQLEQGVAPELEFDGEDEVATQILAYLDGQPVGTARFRLLGEGIVKLERVAVLPAARGLGIGRQIVVYALEQMAIANVATVIIHAQTAVRGLYEKLGFVATGSEFAEADIPHIKMQRQLN